MSSHHSLVNFAHHVTVRIVPALTSNPLHNQNRRNYWRLTPIRLCLLLLLVTFALVGCGPEEGEGNGDFTGETIQIAQEYQQTGDLGNARAQLEKLDVANPTQFLIFLAEERADNEPGTPETNALVHFALALGLQSGQLMDYALANGLLANTVPPTPIPVAQPAAQGLAPVTSAEQTPAATATAAEVAAAESTTSTIPSAVIVDSTSSTSTVATTSTTSTTSATSTTAVSESAPSTDAQLPTATAQAPAATPVTKPMVVASNGLNVRSGPGTDYPVVGALNGGEQAEIVAKNPEGDWWEVTLTTGGTGWVFGALVQTAGDTGSIAVATNIPAAPPTATPAPVAEAPTAAPEQPAEQPTEQPAPAEAPTEPAPATSGNDFAGIERRLWTVEETGGAVDSGGSVRCGEKRELVVIVLDANGNRLNGVAVQAIYGAQEIFVTGSQGKGDGQVEFVLGEGQGVKVIRDADGREVTSDVVDGMITHSPYISEADLIGAHYCRDTESCKKFNFSAGCWGHHSWTVTFKRKY